MEEACLITLLHKKQKGNSFGLVGFVDSLSGCSSRALGASPPVTPAFPTLESFLSRKYSTPTLLFKCFVVYSFLLS